MLAAYRPDAGPALRQHFLIVDFSFIDGGRGQLPRVEKKYHSTVNSKSNHLHRQRPSQAHCLDAAADWVHRRRVFYHRTSAKRQVTPAKTVRATIRGLDCDGYILAPASETKSTLPALQQRRQHICEQLYGDGCQAWTKLKVKLRT